LDWGLNIAFFAGGITISATGEYAKHGGHSLGVFQLSRPKRLTL